jgi:hypothetical protein
VTTQYRCGAEGRREAIRASSTLNGIDFLEVSPNQRTLSVTFLRDSGIAALTSANVVVEGGVRIKPIRVGAVSADARTLSVHVDPPGDFSNYRLRLRSSDTDESPPKGFDPQLSAVDFSFKASCDNDFDCKTDDFCPPRVLPEPELDYLAKDYLSFRRLMLDRLSTLVPSWTERNAADQHVALVELLAYVGDHLSYYQDSVATEAYLGTARKRTSLRRHARLLDYEAHAGCNARAWIAFELADGTISLPKGTRLLTGDLADPPMADPATLATELAKRPSPLVFETVHAATLRVAHNEITLYTWSDDQCCLPAGATRATLLDNGSVTLAMDDVILFEEKLDPVTGIPKAEPDPQRSHAVRLTSVVKTKDPLDETAVVEIAWDAEDALPFPLCVSALVKEPGKPKQLEKAISVARANVVLADHGLSVASAPDPPDPLVPVDVPEGRPYRPRLGEGSITFQSPPDLTGPASWAGRNDPRRALPVTQLEGDGKRWEPARDLLDRGRFDTAFVVETEDDGTAHVRFGDNEHGQAPEPGVSFGARYRIGNGRAGNVGAGMIRRVVLTGAGVNRVWNPLPAVGGADAEPLELVRLSAPEAFRVQQRAVTESDYATIAEREPTVQKAAARFRWTGSWYTAFVAADRTGGRHADAKFATATRLFLEAYRMAGHDLDVEQPAMVPLDLELEVCVKPGNFRSNVKAALLRELGSRSLPDGRLGFFHPDNFTFAQPVYLSQVFARATAVPGVRWLRATRFQRYGKEPSGELEHEVIATAPREIVRLDNDPSFPENGKLELVMQGGM